MSHQNLDLKNLPHHSKLGPEQRLESLWTTISNAICFLIEAALLLFVGLVLFVVLLF